MSYKSRIHFATFMILGFVKEAPASDLGPTSNR